MNHTVTDKRCAVCQGWLIERSEIILDRVNIAITHEQKHYQEQYYDTKIAGYHCDNCGIEYHKLPK